jgi:uncharacterized protein (TIGR00369 family)
MNQIFTPQEYGWKLLNTEGFISTIGPLWSRQIDETWEYGLHVEAHHENPLGIAHGGMLMTFMDQAISMIAWDAAGRKPCATVQLDTHFLSPAKAGDFLVARAEVSRKSMSLIFMRGVLRVAEREIMTAQGMMKIIHRSSD